MLGRTLAATLLAVVLALTTAPSATAGPADKYAGSAHAATNNKRDNHDLRTVKRQACLTRMAVRQAERMADQSRMYHQDLGRVQRRCGVGYVGENVAYGYSSGASVVRAWMRSSGHRANILNRKYRLMGIGARRDDDGRWYVAQVFGRRA